MRTLLTSVITLMLHLQTSISATTAPNPTLTRIDDSSTVVHANNTAISEVLEPVSVTTAAATLPIYKTGALSVEAFQRMRQVQNWIYLAVEPVAVVLMVLCAVAFLRDRHSPSNCYLAAVCLAEGWYMLMLFTHYVCRTQSGCWGQLAYVKVSRWSVAYSAFAARRCGNVLTALVASQRFIAVAFPLKALGVRILHRPAIPLAVCVALCLLLSLYRPLRHQPVFMEGGRGGGWAQGYNQLYREHQAVFMALEEVAKYVLQYLPMLACLLANALLLVALARHRKDAGRLGSTANHDSLARSKAERQMTVMIIGSTLLMLVLNTPVNLNEAVSTYSDTYGVMKKEHYLYLVLRGCLSIVSHTCDILVALSYLVLSANFRRRFLGLFLPARRLLTRYCCCCCRLPPEGQAHTSSTVPAAADESAITRTSSLKPISTVAK